MANRMIHTPTFLATARIGEYWFTVSSTIAVSSDWYVAGSNTLSADLSRVFDSQAGWTIGFKFKYTIAGTPLTPLVQWIDGTTAHMELRLNATTGIFTTTRNGTLVQTGTTVLTMNTEYYVEWRVVIADATNGVSILHVDGVPDGGINASNLDTRNAGNASADRVVLSCYRYTVGDIRFKDIYINDNSGGVDDTFWGPIEVATLVPSADGSGGGGGTNDWAPLSSTNVSNVDDAAADGDTSYNATSTNGDIDTFTMTDTGFASGTVKGVEWVGELRRVDASSTARVAPVLRISGTNYVGTDITPRTTYLMPSERWRLQPVGGTPAWDVSTLDAIEVGYKRTAG